MDSTEKLIAWLVLFVIVAALAIAAYRYRHAAKQFAIGVLGGVVVGFGALFAVAALVWSILTVLR